MTLPTAVELQRSDDIVVSIKYGQRIDQLAYQYLGDGSLWWVICLLNGASTPFSEKFSVGSLIRIPTNVSYILSVIESSNG